jgi:hypothetical protein
MPCSKDGRCDEDDAWGGGSASHDGGCLRLSFPPSHGVEELSLSPSPSASLGLRLSAFTRRMRSASTDAPKEASSLVRLRGLRGGESSRCRDGPSLPL